MARPKPEDRIAPSDRYKEHRRLEAQKKIEDENDSTDEELSEEDSWYETAPGGQLVKYTAMKYEEDTLPKGLAGVKTTAEEEEPSNYQHNTPVSASVPRTASSSASIAGSSRPRRATSAAAAAAVASTPPHLIEHNKKGLPYDIRTHATCSKEHGAIKPLADFTLDPATNRPQFSSCDYCKEGRGQGRGKVRRE